ncbi:MAG: hypothetical protein A4E72_01719 [Syntrophus sp. PtaU1.Bin208]|nr:MAG: hypothetical protein A4E72_01719 [Syntrophus sp. PtaU1.Bin208]
MMKIKRAQAMVQRQACNRSTGEWQRMVQAVLLMLAFLFFIVSAVMADSGAVLPESGILYPDGFDVNTVGVIQGKASHIRVPKSGPVQFYVVTEREIFTVLASPSWYWNDLKGNSMEGMDVRVRGSKTLGRDGNLYLIAQEIRIIPLDKILIFRDADGSPFWRGSGLPGEGRRGFGSPLRGDGSGRGIGSGGRGRR